MTRFMKTSVSALSLAAGLVMLGAGTSAPVQAGVIYYGDHITYREAKRLCDGIHGRVFLGDRDRYGCQGDGPRRAKRRPKLPPPGDNEPQVFSIEKTSKPAKRQNFSGRKDFPGMIGGQGGGNGGGGNGGGGNGGGSAGGPY